MSDLIDTTVLLPIQGNPAAGRTVAVDAIHHEVLTVAPWAPAKPVLDATGEPCDLVLMAVPKGLGQVMALWIGDQTIAVADPAAPSEGRGPR